MLVCDKAKRFEVEHRRLLRRPDDADNELEQAVVLCENLLPMGQEDIVHENLCPYELSNHSVQVF